MVLEEKKVKNICNFYVSEYHLEIMLLPYISKKIDNEENITIITEIDLESTLNVVIERINLDKDKKEKIKKNWLEYTKYRKYHPKYKCDTYRK
mgnify:CR=1 FL=1